MKDYAKVINQSREIHGQKSGTETLAKSAMQKSRETPVSHKKSGSGFFSVVALFILIAILFAVYRQYVHHRALMNALPVSASDQQAQPQPSNPQFDFYSVLPAGGTAGGNANSASTASPSTTTPAAGTSAPAATTGSTTAVAPVVVPTTPPAAAAAPVQTISTGASSGGQYYLDAGEFSNAADAQQMLSQLLLLGVQANTQTIQENGQPAYQVVVGPFDDQDTLNVVKQQLTAHQIQTSVLQQ